VPPGSMLVRADEGDAGGPTHYLVKRRWSSRARASPTRSRASRTTSPS
jgi:hypothetical protein